MLAKLFSGAVRNLLGRETLKSEVYGFGLPETADNDAVGGHLYLEATSHLFDKTKYALTEVVVGHTAYRLTPPDLKQFLETSASVQRNPVKDENGTPYVLTRDEALKKIADYQAGMDSLCHSPDGRFLSYRKMSSEQKPDAPADKASGSAPAL
jgi:hypothetical protein